MERTEGLKGGRKPRFTTTKKEETREKEGIVVGYEDERKSEKELSRKQERKNMRRRSSKDTSSKAGRMQPLEILFTPTRNMTLNSNHLADKLESISAQKH